MHQTQKGTHLEVMAVLPRGPVTTPRSQNRENHGEGPLHTMADNSVDDIPRVNAPLHSFGTMAEPWKQGLSALVTLIQYR